MPEMASYERHVGPWPIKRSQSVPDASIRIFTPRNSPPSLARCLTKVDEDCPQLQLDLAGPSVVAAPKNDWSTYSMQQPLPDVERDGDTEQQRILHGKESSLITMNFTRGYTTFVGVMLSILAYCMVSFCGHPHDRRITLSKDAPSAVWMYCLACMFTAIIGLLMYIASASLGILVERNLVGTRRILEMTITGLLSGVIMALLWMIFILPPIVHEA